VQATPLAPRHAVGHDDLVGSAASSFPRNRIHGTSPVVHEHRELDVRSIIDSQPGAREIVSANSRA
jgi:hypothetical protein